ncbi:hypothetical protein [Jiangella alkaliphila]|uniref:Uncharacterized protein n=1 Tax=Jiangella alkaliphila TaxID=419479 RepID=A0A1H2IFK3_9ACTN|nr:hypothetical protein [Jiangella alkaliphila]SDU42907.1 hypothetical protein SAMN04488563_1679 [Jiangella alkaliphila]
MTRRQIGITILVIIAVLFVGGMITTGWDELRNYTDDDESIFED